MHCLNRILLGVFLTVSIAILTGDNLGAQNPSRVFRFDLEGKTVNMTTVMKASSTSAVSMAIDNGQIDSAFTTGVPEMLTLDTESLFPAGAASALPVCMAILQLVERGVLKLDAPINNYLKQGKLTGGESVTLKDVLLMKPRVGSSYKPTGYYAGSELPEVSKIAEGFRFKGRRKANKGTEYGGWVLLQLVLEQYYREPLNTTIQREVFEPLCLEHMFYATELTPDQRKLAIMGHLENGSAVKGGYKRYVVQSVAGLWTNAADYAKMVRVLMDIRKGKEHSILRPQTVQMAFAERYGHRSLLAHMSDGGNPYWGGNAKGYYFSMQAHFSEDWVSVVAMNRDLNWRLGSPVVWQLGLLGKQWRAGDRLGIILSSDATADVLIEELEHKAFVDGVRTEKILALNGIPAGISATPAFVFQNSAGRAIYGGKHNDLEAISKFIRLNQAKPKKFAADERTNLLGYQRGRQMIVLPIKVTTPTGNNAPAVLPPNIIDALHQQLVLNTPFEQKMKANLNAQDRRIYLDVHSYRTEGGAYQLTYAIYSQFNCHTPAMTNYGEPVSVGITGDGLSVLAVRIASDLTEVLQPTLGFVPVNLPEDTPVVTWADLGWALGQAVGAKQETTTFSAPVAVSGTYRTALTEQDAPGLFFSFPSPLDRYSGEVRELMADFTFSPNGTMLSGQVNLPVASISTTSGSLDTYVLKDLLKGEKFSTASLTFKAVSIPGNWQEDEPKKMIIPAILTIRNKDYPVKVNAVFTPKTSGSLAVAADFGIDFRNVFGRNGPDGPEAIRHQLDFTARFSARPLASK